MGRPSLRIQFNNMSINTNTPPPSPSTQTHRRILSRRSSSSTISTPSPSPTRTSTSSLHNFFHPTSPPSPRPTSPTPLPLLQTPTMPQSTNSIPNPTKTESDAECWERMLALQMEYHCYNSARLEAAVEALENGFAIDMVPIPSRFCLDLLNEELRAQIEHAANPF